MITRFVNTASTAGGDGTTNATSGANRAYATLAAAITAMSSPLTDDWTIECDADTGVADTTQATTAGKNLSTFTLTIKAGAGNGAATQWSTAKYRLSTTTPFAGTLVLTAGTIVVDGVEVENNDTAANGPRGIDCSPGGTAVHSIQNCFVRAPNATTDGSGISHSGTAADTVRVRNSIIHGFGQGVKNQDYRTVGGWVLYNVLCKGQGVSGVDLIDHDGGTTHIKNVAVQDIGSGANCVLGGGSTITSATVLTEDASSPTVGLRSKVIAFVNEAGGNFALATGDTAAKDAGTNLSSDATWAFTDDILGTTRPSVWDVGPHEVVAAGGGPMFRGS